MRVLIIDIQGARQDERRAEHYARLREYRQRKRDVGMMKTSEKARELTCTEDLETREGKK